MFKDYERAKLYSMFAFKKYKLLRFCRKIVKTIFFLLYLFDYIGKICIYSHLYFVKRSTEKYWINYFINIIQFMWPPTVIVVKISKKKKNNLISPIEIFTSDILSHGAELTFILLKEKIINKEITILYFELPHIKKMNIKYKLFFF